MCGICGHPQTEYDRPIDRQLLERMNETIRHRGPDSDGFYVQHNLGLAMRRLAIIDRSGGQQPMTNKDGTVQVVFKGEIYNFRKLRAELEQHCHRFATSSDVEWTARLPERYKVRGQQTKWLLKAAFASKLPPEIATRGKQGFSLPIGPWLRRELRDWSRARLCENRALDEWFRPGAVQRLIDEHDAGRINHGKRLWALLMFALWRNQK